MEGIEFSAKVLDAAGEALLRRFLLSMKPGKEASFRRDIQHILTAAGLAEREEAAARAPEPWDEQRALLAEALHTGWRKGADGPYSLVIHKLIADVMDSETWAEYVTWVDWCLEQAGYRPAVAESPVVHLMVTDPDDERHNGIFTECCSFNWASVVSHGMVTSVPELRTCPGRPIPPT